MLFGPVFSSSPARRSGKENKWYHQKLLEAEGVGGPFVEGDTLFTRESPCEMSHMTNPSPSWGLTVSSVRWVCTFRGEDCLVRGLEFSSVFWI